jgi:hypothetical protein
LFKKKTFFGLFAEIGFCPLKPTKESDLVQFAQNVQPAAYIGISRLWILDIGYWILDIGYWILDIGYWKDGEAHLKQNLKKFQIWCRLCRSEPEGALVCVER